MENHMKPTPNQKSHEQKDNYIRSLFSTCKRRVKKEMLILNTLYF